MKPKLMVSVAWVVVTSLFLCWLCYAVNGFERVMLGAVTGAPGVYPTLNRAREARAKLQKSKSFEERSALLDQIVSEENRYFAARTARFAKESVLRQFWMFEGVVAIVPLFFLWSPELLSWRKRLLFRSCGSEVAEDVKV
jgi:hypothetical protein